MKRKRQLIEHNMAKDVNTTSVLLKAEVTLMMKVNPKEDTFNIVKLELTLIIGLKKRKTSTTKNMN